MGSVATDAHERARELTAGYALGALDRADAAFMAEHLVECPLCRAEVEAFGAVTAALARTPDPLSPAPALRARLVAAAQAEGERRITRRRWGGWALGAAAAACIIGLGIDDARLRGQLGSTQTQLSAAERALILQQKIADPVLAGEPLYRLAPTAGSGPSAVWVRPPNRAPYLVAPDLPALGPAKTYELWFLQGATPLPAGTFAPDAILTTAALPPSITALAVTVEPHGGSAKPTSAPILVGKL